MEEVRRNKKGIIIQEPTKVYMDYCEELEINWQDAWKDGLTMEDLNQLNYYNEESLNRTRYNCWD